VKRRIAPVIALLAILLGVSLAIPVTAHAHSELASSVPENGAVLDAAPPEVILTFNEDLLPDFVSVVASGPQGDIGELPITAVEGPTATIAWPGQAPAGEWTVSYRVVSQDGHPVEGSVSFAYEAPSPSPASSSPSPTSAAPTTSAPPPSSADPTPAPSPEASPAADASSGISGGAIAAIAIALVIVVGVVIALVARRRA